MMTESVLPLGCERGTIGGPNSAIDNSATHVRMLIHSGELRAGDRLPPEAELCTKLGVSRATLRVALKILETFGYVVVRRGKDGGTWVVGPDTLRKRWAEWVEANKQRLDQMLAFRSMVEREIAALAAKNRTPADLERLEASCCPSPEELPFMGKWDGRFHRALLLAAHNEYLERAVVTLAGDMFILPPEGDLLRRDWLLENHRAVLEAVRNRDSEGAVKSITEEIAALQGFLEQLLQPAGSDTSPE